MAQTCTNLPFGDQMSCSGTSTTPYAFTDDMHDAETGLEHTMFRQYSSTQGRWLGPDPAGMMVADATNPQSWNRYAYVTNDPVNLFDPFGLDPLGNGGDGGTCGGNDASFFSSRVNSTNGATSTTIGVQTGTPCVPEYLLTHPANPFDYQPFCGGAHGSSMAQCDIYVFGLIFAGYKPPRVISQARKDCEDFQKKFYQQTEQEYQHGIDDRFIDAMASGAKAGIAAGSTIGGVLGVETGVVPGAVLGGVIGAPLGAGGAVFGQAGLELWHNIKYDYFTDHNKAIQQLIDRYCPAY